MPLYEYVCEQDGEVLELIRPMDQADSPVADPKGRGRTFKRRLSTFATAGASAEGRSLPASGGGCCPCGKSAGMCSKN
jgi:putative FmdB family regulatory protein